MGRVKTPLFPYHQAHAQKLVNFHDWEMPLYFSSIRAEHLAVRSRAGFFDVSHMGKIRLSASAFDLQSVIPSRVPVHEGRCRYTFILDDQGRILDDVIICRVSEASYLCVCNAGPRKRIVGWFEEHLGKPRVRDFTSELVCLALQGPEAENSLQRLSRASLSGLRPFRGLLTELPGGVPVETEGWASLGNYLDVGTDPRGYYVTRTGYTGEDGFEIYAPNPMGVALWKALVEKGGISPIGLGARDTLRLEKGYLLSGQDFDGRQTPYEVGYERLVHWDHEFVGRDALERWKGRTNYRRLQGIQLLEPGVPRPGYAVWREDREVGVLTSGTSSPTLGIGIGLGYLDSDARTPGQSLEIEVRAKRLQAEVRRPPFVR